MKKKPLKFEITYVQQEGFGSKLSKIYDTLLAKPSGKKPEIEIKPTAFKEAGNKKLTSTIIENSLSI